jgi:hypothetical protein
MANSWINSVRVASTSNVTTAGLITIDGIALSTGDRVLLKDQTNAVENGVWVCDTGAWSRAADFATGFSVTPEVTVRVSEGSVHAHSEWTLFTQGVVNVGTTPLTFRTVPPLKRFASVGALQAYLAPEDAVVVVDGFQSAGDGGGGTYALEQITWQINVVSSQTVTVVSVSGAVPNVVTASGHGFVNGQAVAIVGTNTSADGQWIISLINADQFSLNNSWAMSDWSGSAVAVSSTVTTNHSHHIPSGSSAVVAGVTGAAAALNGRWRIVSAPSANALTIPVGSVAVGIATGSVGDGVTLIPSAVISRRWLRLDPSDNNVRVVDFGAIGDGIADDWSALQSAYNYAQARNVGLMLAAGKTYAIGRELQFWSQGNRIAVVGNGASIVSTGSMPTTCRGQAHQ